MVILFFALIVSRICGRPLCSIVSIVSRRLNLILFFGFPALLAQSAHGHRSPALHARSRRVKYLRQHPINSPSIRHQVWI